MALGGSKNVPRQYLCSDRNYGGGREIRRIVGRVGRTPDQFRAQETAQVDQIDVPPMIPEHIE